MTTAEIDIIEEANKTLQIATARIAQQDEQIKELINTCGTFADLVNTKNAQIDALKSELASIRK
jgi:uncharacterized protein YoxC